MQWAMLSQAEIDALLRGALEVDKGSEEDGINLSDLIDQPAPIETPSKEKQDKNIRPYNFWSPNPFSKEQLRAVELVHEDLAERLTSSLPPHIRTNIRPRVVLTEQGRFDDYLREIPPASLFHMIRLPPLPGRMVLTISPDISWVILGRLLGGTEDRNPTTMEELTEIGQALLEMLVSLILNDIKAAWSRVTSVDPELEDSTTNQHWVQMVMGNERVMLITFEISIRKTTGTMSIYIPFSMLKPIADVLNPHVWISGKEERKPDPAIRRALTESIQEIRVPLRVVLGQAVLDLHELLNLQHGDIIPLNAKIDRPLPTYIGNQLCFQSRPGKMGSQLAIQIENTLSRPMP